MDIPILLFQIQTYRHDVYHSNSQDRNYSEIKLQSDLNCDIILLRLPWANESLLRALVKLSYFSEYW